MPRTVLVVDGGSGPALAAVRSLGRAGWRVLACAGTRSAASRFVDERVEIPDAADDPHSFADRVRHVLARERIDVVVPCTDATVELLWASSEHLRGARIMGADQRSFETATDKAGALAAADRVGFPTPAWAAPTSPEEAAAALDRIGFPCVVKPRRSYVATDNGLLHRRHGFLRRREELEAVLAGATEMDGTFPLLQAFVPGRSLAVSAVLREGRVLASVARETLTFVPIAGGTSVWKRTIPPDDVGVEAAVELLRALEYEGLAEVEYQVEEGGTPRLMEIGVRAHGWLALAIAAGVDLPLIAARALLGDELPDAGPYSVGVEMRWPAGEIARLRKALARRPELPPGVSRWDVISRAWPPWRPGMRYDGVDLSDLRPWLPARIRSLALGAPALQ